MENIRRREWTDLNYAGWCEFFEENDRHRLDVEALDDVKITGREKRLLASSVKAFCKGEHSEGSYLRHAAAGFAQRYKEVSYPDAIELFIREENFHSAYLAVWLRRHKMTLARHTVLDRIFRQLRRLFGFRSEQMVLVTAEMIALTYYSALAQATTSPALQRICAQMLHDELPHIVFQSYSIGHYRQTLFLRTYRRVMMELTTQAVYLAYKPFFLKAGMSLAEFRAENLGYLAQSQEIAGEVAGHESLEGFV